MRVNSELVICLKLKMRHIVLNRPWQKGSHNLSMKSTRLWKDNWHLCDLSRYLTLILPGCCRVKIYSAWFNILNPIILFLYITRPEEWWKSNGPLHGSFNNHPPPKPLRVALGLNGQRQYWRGLEIIDDLYMNQDIDNDNKKMIWRRKKNILTKVQTFKTELVSRNSH